MYLSFYKYQGTGNDFIIVDCMTETVSLNKEQIIFLCNRKFGIGADGLMMIVADTETDFLMEYYNADGNTGSMCGNGGRCIVNYAFKKKYIGMETNFRAADGVHKAIITDTNANRVRLQMGDIKKPVLDSGDVILDTGSPHYVRFVKSAEETNVVVEGRKIRFSEAYMQRGININFVEMQMDELYVRTYERGVEDETLSCGTGVTASVIAAAFTNLITENGEQKVKTPGGILSVQYKKSGDGYSDVWLEGDASFVYAGKINIV